MTNQAIQAAAAAVPNDAVVSLKVTRADLINQVVREAHDRHADLRKQAADARLAASQEFVDAVNAYAEKKFKPLIDMAERHCNAVGPVRADWSATFGPVRADMWRDEVSKTNNQITVQIRDGERYDRNVDLRVTLTLTKPLMALRQKVIDACNAEYELGNTGTLADMRSNARDKLIRQSIENSPEGQAALAAIRALTTQIETASGKALTQS